MAAEDDMPHDWDPEKEKRQTDPVEQARAVAKAFAEQAAIEQAKHQKRLAAMPKRPMDLQFAVHKISNGWIVIYSQTPVGYQGDRGNSREIYADTPAAVVAAVLRVTQGHLDGKLDGAEEGTCDGRPPGPFLGGAGVGETF